jgi:hypothetical protein
MRQRVEGSVSDIENELTQTTFPSRQQLDL